MPVTPVLDAQGISKAYGGVTALRGADLTLDRGEIHAIVGENGAGKSTLVKIISGVAAPDSGQLSMNGDPVSFGTALDAQRAGVAIVAQELSLFPDLSVRENMFPRRLPRRMGLIDSGAIDRAAAPVFEQLGLDVAMHVRVGELTLADQQMLEIARAIIARPSVLVLDEPTSAQPRHAVSRLEAVLRRLTADGLSVLYISHFLEEVMRMADRITVLRDGAVTEEGRPVGETDLDSLVTAMIGGAVPVSRRIESPPGSAAHPGGDCALVIDSITVPGEVEDVSLRVDAGETVGIVGLQGAGHLAVMAAVCGRRRVTTGTVTLPSGASPRSLRHAMASGLAFLPSDRKRYGLMLDKTVWENVAEADWAGLGRGGPWLRRRRLREDCTLQLAPLRVKGSPDTIVGQLSGGNQQKVVFAKLLQTGPDVLVLDDPTRGVDIGARAEMHNVVRGFAADGHSVLLTSSDLAELVDLCDRVVVLQHGRVTAVLDHTELSEASLSKAMNAGFVLQG